MMFRNMVVAVACFVSVFTGQQAAAQSSQLGLVFASPEQLSGIPLASTPYSGAELPLRVDLSSRIPPPGDQGNQQSCVAWTLAYALKSYHEHLEEGHPIRDANGGPVVQNVFSPAFIYNQINQGRDGGALFVDGLNLLSSQGVAPWGEMPYTEADYLTRPSSSALRSAERYRIDYWRRVNVQDIREVKAQLNAGYPVIIGAVVDEGFINIDASAMWTSIRGAQRGGHAMLLVGYDDSRGAFRIINSWGRSWGDQGYGWIAYDFFPQVVREGYVAKDARNGPPPSPSPTPTIAPSPTDRANAVNFNVTGVQHNVQAGNLGPAMRFQGTVTIPPNSGANAQVVITIWVNDGQNGKSYPIGSVSPQFATPQGQAATGTGSVPLPSQGVTTTWSAILPYYTLNVPRGMVITPFGLQGAPITSYLVAEPMLFIDSFGVRTFAAIPFFVVL